MAARKKSSRTAASKRGGRKAGKRTGPKAGKKKARRARAGTRKAAGAGKKRTRRPSSLADRLTHLVEDLAAGALRRMVDTGGRELAGWLPDAPEMRREAGAYVRELREVAGLTLDELADAVELRDRSLLEAVEQGTATLSFELILRLAAVLARHDPVPFVAHLLRSYNPVLWQLLDDWGVGRLPLQLERERQFVNVLRGHDGARGLSDEDFERVLAFTRSAFETAMHFAGEPAPTQS